MQKSLYIDPAKCTGCLQCEMACSYEHTGAINPSKSRIKVFDFEHEGRKVPYTCTQCSDAWCLNACPVHAIRVDATTGAKVVHEDTCVGCKVCTIACPFGTVNYMADVGKVQKCDLGIGVRSCINTSHMRTKDLTVRSNSSTSSGLKSRPGSRPYTSGRPRLLLR